MIRGSLTLLFALCLHMAWGQSKPKELKWGQIPREDLEMTTYAPDPEAEAVVLDETGLYLVDIGQAGLMTKLTVVRRIKILKESGLEQANKSISYHRGKVGISIKAHLIQPDGTDVPLEKNQIYDQKATNGIGFKKFTFPKVTVGSVLEYKVEYTSTGLSRNPAWTFQSTLPVRFSQVNFSIPEYFRFTKVISDNRYLTTSKNSKENVYNVTYKMNIPTDDYLYIAESVPAFKDDDYTIGGNDNLINLTFKLVALELPNSIRENLTPTWPELARDLRESSDFGKQYLKASLTKQVYQATAGLLTPDLKVEEKIKKIYTYLLDQIAWDGSYDMWPDQPLDRVYQAKKGNSAALNLLLISVLRQHGFDAFPVLTATRNYGLIDPVFPSSTQFNHVLAVVAADNKSYIMDLGDKKKPFHLIGYESLSDVGWAITESDERWVSIQAEIAQQQWAFQLQMQDNGALDGWAIFNASDYFGWRERNRLSQDALPWKSMLEEKLPGVVMDSLTIEGKEHAEPTLKAKLHVHADNGLQAAEGGFIMPAVLMTIFSKNPFEKEQRSTKVHLGFPIKERYNLSLKLPAGWKLDEVPVSVQMALPEQQGKIVFSARQVDQTVNATLLLELKKIEFTPEEYKALHDFIIKYFECQQQMLVLKKA